MEHAMTAGQARAEIGAGFAVGSIVGGVGATALMVFLVPTMEYGARLLVLLDHPRDLSLYVRIGEVFLIPSLLTMALLVGVSRRRLFGVVLGCGACTLFLPVGMLRWFPDLTTVASQAVVALITLLVAGILLVRLRRSDAKAVADLTRSK